MRRSVIRTAVAMLILLLPPLLVYRHLFSRTVFWTTIGVIAAMVFVFGWYDLLKPLPPDDPLREEVEKEEAAFRTSAQAESDDEP